MKTHLTLIKRAIQEIDAGSFSKNLLNQASINMVEQARTLLWNVINQNRFEINFNTRMLIKISTPRKNLNPNSFFKMIVVEDAEYGDILGWFITYDKEDAPTRARIAMNEAKENGAFDEQNLTPYMEKQGFYPVNDVYRMDDIGF